MKKLLLLIFILPSNNLLPHIIKLTNTISGKKELFKSLEPNKVTLYVCGLTPYDYAHIGHGRVYVLFDVLYRLLTFSDYNVIYCRNFTDTCDKILEKSYHEFNTEYRYLEIADIFINHFKQKYGRA